MAGRVADRALMILDTYMWERGQYPMLREKPASILSSAIIHAARTEELRSSKKDDSLEALWPKELETLTRYAHSDIEELSWVLLKLNSMQP